MSSGSSGMCTRDAEPRSGETALEQVESMRKALGWFADPSHYGRAHGRRVGFVDALGITVARRALGLCVACGTNGLCGCRSDCRRAPEDTPVDTDGQGHAAHSASLVGSTTTEAMCAVCSAVRSEWAIQGCEECNPIWDWSDEMVEAMVVERGVGPWRPWSECGSARPERSGGVDRHCREWRDARVLFVAISWSGALYAAQGEGSFDHTTGDTTTTEGRMECTRRLLGLILWTDALR